MGLRCKVGDMARVDHPVLPENKGLIVEVLRIDADFVEPTWFCKPAWPSPWFDRDTGALGGIDADKSSIEDWRLTPIRPSAPPESVDTPENVETTA